MARDFDQIYAEAPGAAVGRLTAFRERYPGRYGEARGRLYRVWDVCDGPSDEVYVFFPSGIGAGEIWFPYMLELRRRARCIAVSYAEDATAAEYCDAMAIVLEELGVGPEQPITVFGMSVGGLVAQVFAQRERHRVKGLVLAFTGTSAVGLDEAQRQKWLLRRKLRWRMKFQNYGPMDKLGMASDMFKAVCPEPFRERQAFWSAYFEDSFDQYVYKAQHLAINTQLIPDIYDSHRFTQDDFDPEMRVLVLESPGDKTYTEQERGVLGRVFPQAQVREIGPNGQFSMQIDEGLCLEAIEAFLGETPS